MKTWSLSLLGCFMQTFFLLTFILVSRTTGMAFAKPWIVGATILGMLLLLAYAERRASIRRLVLLSANLAVGYIVGFHVLGFLFFPGLLKDLDLASIGYWRSIFFVMLMIFGAYIFVALGLHLFRRFFSKIKTK